MNIKKMSKGLLRIVTLTVALAMVISLFGGMNFVRVKAALAEPVISQPIYVGDGSIEGANVSKNLAVGNDGAIYAVYKGSDEGIYIRKSMDNGLNFSSAVKVANNGSECEVAVSSTGRVFVSYHANNEIEGGTDCYVAYSDDCSSFTSVKVENSSFIYHHIAVNGDNVYAIANGGQDLYYSSDGGEHYSLAKTLDTPIADRPMAFTVPLIDKETDAVMILRDNPAVDVYINNSADCTEDFTYYNYLSDIEVYYSTADFGKYGDQKYLYTSGRDGTIYRIKVGAEVSENSYKLITINGCGESYYLSRSLTADYKGNVAVGYADIDSDTGNCAVYYQVSDDGGEHFKTAVKVADGATAANAAINPIVGSLLYMYEKNSEVYLVVIDGVLSNYDVTANPTALPFAPSDATSHAPRTFEITNNGDSPITINSVTATSGFTASCEASTVAANSTAEVSVVYNDSSVKSGTVTVTYNGNKTLTVGLSISNTISAAEAADANATSNTVTVKSIDANTYYALYTVDDSGNAVNKIRGWISGAITSSEAAARENVELSGSDLVFTGLTPDTGYIVRTVSKDAFDGGQADNSEYYLDAGVTTAIDPIAKNDQNLTPIITPSETTISVTNLQSCYTYGLYDSTKKKIAAQGAFKAATDGMVEFTGLTPNTTYYFAAKSATNDLSDKIQTKTLKSHVHAIKYKVENDIIKAYCITTDPNTCEFYSNGTFVNVEFNEEATISGGEYVNVNVYPENGDAGGPDIPDPTVKYTGKVNGETAYNSTSKPTQVGKYKVTVTCGSGSGAVSLVYNFEIKVKVDENGDPVMNGDDPVLVVVPGESEKGESEDNYEETRAVYEDTSKIAYTDGYLHFSKNNEHVIMYASTYDIEKQTTGSEDNSVYLDLTAETITADFVVKCYSLDGGNKWKSVSTTPDSKAIGKWFNAERTILIADNYDASSKGPGTDANVYYIGVTQKRATTSSLKADYYTYRDNYGLTTGQWKLKTLKGDKSVDMSLLEFMPLDNVGAALSMNDDVTADPKDIPEEERTGIDLFESSVNGTVMTSANDLKEFSEAGYWGKWPTNGGVWVPTIGAGNKAQKAKIQYRIAASYSGGKYTPASQAKKVNIASSVKAPTVKADYKKEVIKFKKGLCVYFGEKIALDENYKPIAYSLPERDKLLTYNDYYKGILLNMNVDQAKDFPIGPYLTATRNTVLVWQLATEKKPASAVQTIVLAARGQISEEDQTASVTKGKASANSNYEYYDTNKSKWVAVKNITVTTDTAFRIRLKNTAKGGAETDTSRAAGIEGTLMVYSDGTKATKAVITRKTGDAVVFNHEEEKQE